MLLSQMLFIRGEQVLIDEDLADLYHVETRVLKQAVRRNINRFPTYFMFELNIKEWHSLRSHFVILEKHGRAENTASIVRMSLPNREGHF